MSTRAWVERPGSKCLLGSLQHRSLAPMMREEKICTVVVSFLFFRRRTENTRAQVESRGLFGKRTTYDNPWAPGITEKGLGDLAKVLRSGDMGHVPTEQETLEDLPQAEVSRACHHLSDVQQLLEQQQQQQQQ